MSKRPLYILTGTVKGERIHKHFTEMRIVLCIIFAVVLAIAAVLLFILWEPGLNTPTIVLIAVWAGLLGFFQLILIPLKSRYLDVLPDYYQIQFFRKTLQLNLYPAYLMRTSPVTVTINYRNIEMLDEIPVDEYNKINSMLPHWKPGLMFSDIPVFVLKMFDPFFLYRLRLKDKQFFKTPFVYNKKSIVIYIEDVKLFKEYIEKASGIRL